MTGFKMDDAQKLRWDLLPPTALTCLVEVYSWGTQVKGYPDRNWEKGMAWSRPFAACMRHLWAWWGGQDKDPESGLSHLAHAAWNVMALLDYAERCSHEHNDDRP